MRALRADAALRDRVERDRVERDRVVAGRECDALDDRLERARDDVAR